MITDKNLDSLKTSTSSLCESLNLLRMALIDMCVLTTIRIAYNNKNIKIYNPHCSKWKNCKKSISGDCFMCDLNNKGTEQYILEKLTNDVKEIMER